MNFENVFEFYEHLSICHVDPLEEADEWKDEDFDFQTPGFSAKAASPAYTRKIINPMGATPNTVRKLGSQSVDNLKEMFPNGIVHNYSTTVTLLFLWPIVAVKVG